MNMKYALMASLCVMLIHFTAGCSKSAETPIAGAERAIGESNYRSAVIQLKSALQLEPTNLRARWLLGEAYLAMGLGADAEKELRRAEQLGVASDAVIPVLAQALIAQGKADEVLALGESQANSAASRGELAAAKGLAHLIKEDSEPADRFTLQGLQLAPASRFAGIARTQYFLSESKLSEAGQLLEELLANYPADGQVWSLQGDLHSARNELEAAEKAYATASQNRYANVHDRLKLIGTMIRLDKLEPALVSAEELTGDAPKVARAWYLRGLIHFNSGEFEPAHEYLDRAYQLDDSDVYVTLLFGWSNLTIGNINQAESLVRRVMAKAPDLVSARQLSATISLRLDRGKAAEAAIRPVVESYPDNAQAKNLLVASLVSQNKWDEAADVLAEIAAMHVDSPEIQARVGVGLLRVGRTKQAVEVLQTARELSGDAALVNTALVSGLLSEQAPDAALASARRFLDKAPTDPAAMRLVAFTHLARGEIVPATKMLSKVLAVTPGDQRAVAAMADIMVSEGRPGAATRLIERAVAANPDEARLAVALAMAFGRDGRVEEAKARLQEAIAKDPSDPVPLLMLTRQLLDEGNALEALRVIPDRLASEYAEVLTERAGIKLRLGRYAEARADLERVVSMRPGDSLVRFQLAFAHGGLGDQKRMDRELRAAAQLDPDNKQVRLAQVRSMAAAGQHAKAAASLDSLDVAEGDPDLIRTRQLIAGSVGDKEGFLHWSERLAAVQPSTQNLIELSRAHLAVGDVAAAGTLLLDWLDDHPTDRVVLVSLAGIYDGDKSGAGVDNLRDLAVKFPNDTVVATRLARRLAKSAPAEALSVAERAYRLAGTDAVVLSTYAAVLTENGRFEQALTMIDRAVSETDDELPLRFQRVVTLRRAGRLTEALVELRELRAAGLPNSLKQLADRMEGRLKAAL